MAKSPALEFFKSKSDVFLKDIIFQTGRSLMLCVKQEGRLEHRSSPSGITNHKLELLFCNEPDSPWRIESFSIGVGSYVAATGRVER